MDILHMIKDFCHDFIDDFFVALGGGGVGLLLFLVIDKWTSLLLR